VLGILLIVDSSVVFYFTNFHLLSEKQNLQSKNKNSGKMAVCKYFLITSRFQAILYKHIGACTENHAYRLDNILAIIGTCLQCVA